MLNLLTFIIGIVGIFLIARYNKSNKLFWSLVISMMAGFVGGSIAANMKRECFTEYDIVQYAHCTIHGSNEQ